MSATKWKRPESVPYPSVWRRFDGRTPIGPNNVIPKFRIQDISEDLWDVTLEHLTTVFCRDSPTLGSFKLLEDKEAMNEYVVKWKAAFNQRLALACVVENWEELGDPELPKLAGCNINNCIYRDYKDPPPQSATVRRVAHFVNMMLAKVDWYQKYGVTEYMYALGLSVDPIYRGHGIGLELLKARYDIGKAVGMKLTVTLFTPYSSQLIAERAGFETVAEMPYEDYKVDGEVVFKNMEPAKTAKLMIAILT